VENEIWWKSFIRTGIGDERKKATNDGRSLSLDNSEEKEGRYRVMNTFRRSRVYAGESDIRNLEVKSLAAKGIFRSGPEMTVSSPDSPGI